MFEKFDIPCQTQVAGLYSGTLREDLEPFAPARFVPAMRTPDGITVGDTLAMGETLAERHPDAGLWPEDPAARALARWLCAEMHSSFTALRDDCPMYLRHAWEGFAPSDEVRADLARLEALWSLARERHGVDSPWLFAGYSLADVFFAPAAMRIAAYGLPVGPDAQAYVSAHLADPAIAAWRLAGDEVAYDPMPYQLDLPKRRWPES